MKVGSFIQFLLDKFNVDDNIEISHCVDGGCLITVQNGYDDSLICISDEEDYYYNGEWIDEHYKLLIPLM